MTEVQRKALGSADHRGIIDCPGGRRSFAKASWEKMMSRLVEGGFVTVYRHGGYEITDAGRAALEGKEGS